MFIMHATCAQCGKVCPATLDWDTKASLDPSFIRGALKVYGWLLEENGDHLDAYCSNACSRGNNFEEVTNEFDRKSGGERWLRRIDADCWISALYRRTGFGWMEWETALVFRRPVKPGDPAWKDRDCLIIAGDRREELNDMPKEQLRDWYERNIDGNRNSMETILHALKEANENTPGNP